MHQEAGEHRAFLPPLVAFLERVGAREIVLEEGYGQEMGLTLDDYRRASARARGGSLEEALAQDVVLVLRCPREPLLRRLRRGAVLVSMLHYPTRPGRLELMGALGVRGVSLDGVVDDNGRRLVENLEQVAWYGVREAVKALAAGWPDLERPGRRPVRALTLGAGALAGQAVRAVARYGDPALAARLQASGVSGVEHVVLDWDVTRDEEALRRWLAWADLVIDATARPDPTRVVVPNAWLGLTAPHAVLLDLAADPYLPDREPFAGKAIEGLPHGTLDRWLFSPDDPAWAALDPRVPTGQRRTTLSCNAWPGIEPRACMELYGPQIEPVLRVVLERGLDRVDPLKGPFFDRAVARADSTRWRPPAT
jgi:alanine dehydrogenase